MHINNLYKEQTILLFKECWALEKIHGCVQKGTKISLANGSEIPVEEISIGDVILTFDENKKEFITSVVKNVIIQEKTEKLRWLKLTLKNGRILTCTEDHPILTKNRNWVNALDLDENDEIIDISM